MSNCRHLTTQLKGDCFWCLECDRYIAVSSEIGQQILNRNQPKLSERQAVLLETMRADYRRLKIAAGTRDAHELELYLQRVK